MIYHSFSKRLDYNLSLFITTTNNIFICFVEHEFLMLADKNLSFEMWENRKSTFVAT